MWVCVCVEICVLECVALEWRYVRTLFEERRDNKLNEIHLEREDREFKILHTAEDGTNR